MKESVRCIFEFGRTLSHQKMQYGSSKTLIVGLSSDMHTAQGISLVFNDWFRGRQAQGTITRMITSATKCKPCLEENALSWLATYHRNTYTAKAGASFISTGIRYLTINTQVHPHFFTVVGAGT